MTEYITERFVQIQYDTGAVRLIPLRECDFCVSSGSDPTLTIRWKDKHCFKGKLKADAPKSQLTMAERVAAELRNYDLIDLRAFVFKKADCTI